jgi:hypothetical protein
MDGAVLKRVLIDEALEVLFQLARDFRGSPRTWAVDEAWRALVGKAMDPLAQSGISKRQCVGDGLEALAFDNFAHGLGTAEDPSLLGLFQESV